MPERKTMRFDELLRKVNAKRGDRLVACLVATATSGSSLDAPLAADQESAVAAACTTQSVEFVVIELPSSGTPQRDLGLSDQAGLPKLIYFDGQRIKKPTRPATTKKEDVDVWLRKMGLLKATATDLGRTRAITRDALPATTSAWPENLPLPRMGEP